MSDLTGEARSAEPPLPPLPPLLRVVYKDRYRQYHIMGTIQIQNGQTITPHLEFVHQGAMTRAALVQVNRRFILYQEVVEAEVSKV